MEALTNISGRIARKLEIGRELSQSENRDQLRIFDLINANIANIKKGAELCRGGRLLPAPTARKSVRSSPSLSPSQNARNTIKDTELKTPSAYLPNRYGWASRSSNTLTLFLTLSRAGTPREIGELRAELETGVLRRQRSRQKPAAPLGRCSLNPMTGLPSL